MNDLFAKTNEAFAENEKKLTELTASFGTEVKSIRDGIHAWPLTFAS